MGLADAVFDGIKDFTGLDLDFVKDIFEMENLQDLLPDDVKPIIPAEIRDLLPENIEDYSPEDISNLIPEEFKKVLPENLSGVSAPSSGCSESPAMPKSAPFNIPEIDGLSLSDGQIQNGIDALKDLENSYKDGGFFDLDASEQNPLISAGVKFFGSLFGGL